MRISAVAYGDECLKAIQVGGMEYELHRGRKLRLPTVWTPRGG